MMGMDSASFLSTIAQLGLGFAGFSGIVWTFGKAASKPTETERYRLSLLLAISLIPMFMALMPFVLSQFSISESDLWAKSSLTMAGVTLCLCDRLGALDSQNHEHHPRNLS